MKFRSWICKAEAFTFLDLTRTLVFAGLGALGSELPLIELVPFLTLTLTGPTFPFFCELAKAVTCASICEVVFVFTSTVLL